MRADLVEPKCIVEWMVRKTITCELRLSGTMVLNAVSKASFSTGNCSKETGLSRMS
jgi:hypothetical protein